MYSLKKHLSNKISGLHSEKVKHIFEDIEYNDLPPHQLKVWPWNWQPIPVKNNYNHKTIFFRCHVCSEVKIAKHV